MRALTKSTVSTIAVVFMAGWVVYFGGCSRGSPLGPPESAPEQYTFSVSKISGDYPQYTSRVYKWQNDIQLYQEGNMIAINGSIFKIRNNGLTAPPGTPYGEDVTITMQIEADTLRNELVFTFGPSGCQFNPMAEVWFDWNDLGASTTTLYRIDEAGNYIEHTPDYVDLQGKRTKIYIEHFSRYAVAFTN